MLHEDEHGRIRSLAAMARALGRPEPLPRLLEMAAEEARGTLRAASVSVSRLEPGGITVRTIVNVGDLGPTEVRWPEDETYEIHEFVDLDLSLDELVTWAWDVDDPGVKPSERVLLERLGKAYSLAAPLIVEGQLWGEVYATRHHGARPFDADDVAYLDALLAILAGAVSRATREQSLAQLAFHDPLTGLLNRRALDEATAAAFRVPAGVEREVAVVVVDINDLKAVNDTHGHNAGDQVIKSTATSLLRSFAQLPGSLVARVGGDEFTVLVTERPLAKVVAVSDQLAVASWEGATASPLSCGAAGVVLTEGSDMQPASLFAAADQAQYVAKRRRLRTTAVAAEPEAAPWPS
jgi:diguanylate cyclase (GGDEF)-like protein